MSRGGLKKTVLIIEDDLVEMENARKELEGAGLSVETAGGIDDTDGLNLSEFDCLVVDLNMNNKSLEKDLRERTQGGKLTGWVWLYYIAKKELKSGVKVLIYSEFIGELEEDLGGIIGEQADYYKSKNLRKLRKTAAVSGCDVLCKSVIELLSGSNR